MQVFARGSYTEALLVMSAEDIEVPTRYMVRLYQQPIWRRWRWRFYHQIWEPITWRAYLKLDKPITRLHKWRCPNNCGWATYPDGRTEDICGYIPWSVRQDLRCYDWEHDHDSTVAEIEVSKMQYNLMNRRSRKRWAV